MSEVRAPAQSPGGGVAFRGRTSAEHRAGLWPLAAFVLLAYAISWAWEFPLVVADAVIERGVGWPTHLPALLGPGLAALVVTALFRGRAHARDLLARAVRWRMSPRWWVATLSPAAFLGVALVVAAASGGVPAASGFGRYSGLPEIGVVPVAVVVVAMAFGEEIGWRGFALPLLQRRHVPLAAALVLTPIWVVWHLPLFATVATYRGFAPAGYVGFTFGIACGSIVLTWLYNGTGGSILACAIWHGLYNLASGTTAASGTIAAVTSTFVSVQAVLLVALEVRARHRGTASILDPCGARWPAAERRDPRPWTGGRSDAVSDRLVARTRRLTLKRGDAEPDLRDRAAERAGGRSVSALIALLCRLGVRDDAVAAAEAPVVAKRPTRSGEP